MSGAKYCPECRLAFIIESDNGRQECPDCGADLMRPSGQVKWNRDHAEDTASPQAHTAGEEKSAQPQGLKFDEGKLDWTLLPFGPVEDVVRVLEFGRLKYDRDNWQLVDDAERRYLSALFRHLVARLKGEVYDPETGLSHMSHIACNALFLRHFEMEKESNE